MASLLTPSTTPSREVYGKNFNTEQMYLTTLSVRNDPSLGGSFSVSTPMDETFSISMSSEWSTPFAKSNTENLQGLGVSQNKADLLNFLMQGAGLNAKSKAQTVQVWESSSGISMTIPFTLIAYTDAAKEVRDVSKNLLKLQAPSLAGAGLMLQAPGPTVAGEFAKSLKISDSGRDITLQIGNFLTLRHCIVKNVDVQYDSRFDVNGVPISAKCTVAVESFYTCFTVDDIDELFKR